MIVEIIRFGLAEGADASGFARLNDRYQEDVAYQSAGLARRTVARDDDGRWLDMRLWSDDSPREMSGDEVVRRAWDDSVVIESRDVYRGL